MQIAESTTKVGNRCFTVYWNDKQFQVNRYGDENEEYTIMVLEHQENRLIYTEPLKSLEEVDNVIRKFKEGDRQLWSEIKLSS